MSVAYGLPPTVREFGVKPGQQSSVPLAKVAPRSAALGVASHSLLEGPDEKDDNGLGSADAGDEMERAYIPLALARTKMAALSDELAAMKARHLTLMDGIAARYEALQAASRAHFEGVVDEVKARASLRLKENKATMEELREEIVLLQEAQAARNQTYRAEVKAAVKEQGRLQQLLIDTEAEAATLRAQHDSESAAFAARKDEIDMLMATRVPKEEFEALQAQRDALEQQQQAEAQDFATRSAALTAEGDEARAALAALTATHEALQAEHASATASLAEREEELRRARAEAEETKASLITAEESVASLTAQMAEAGSISEAALEAARAETQALQDRLNEQESKVSLLETQLLTAQASGGSGSGDGPARIVTVVDPELQGKVRSLEGEMNKLLRENAELARVLNEREEAVSASNDALAQAKSQGKSSMTVGVAGSGAAAAGADDDDAGEASEYEDQEVEEEYTEEVPVEGEPGASSSGSSVENPARAQTSSQLRALETTLASQSTQISSLEQTLKPMVQDYKRRLAEFKSDQLRKDLEAELAFGLVDPETGTAQELKPADLKQLEELLEGTAAQATLKPQLAARVNTLKEEKKTMDSNKGLLAELKASIGEMKSSGAPPEEIKSKEDEFMSMRSRMQADAASLRDSYSVYETSLKEFKQKESDLQALLAKFHIDDDHPEDKPRKLSSEKQQAIERLLSLVAGKARERDALKSLAEEVNQKNAALKALKAERDTAQAEAKTLQQQLEEMPATIAGASSSSGASSQRTMTRTAKRMVTRRVKKARPARSARPAAPAAAASSSSSASQPLLPASLLLNLRPIDLKGKGKFAPREFVPVTPAVFKAPEVSEAPEAAAAPASAAAGGSDPALKAKYDTLFAKSQRLESELDALRLSSSGSADALAAKESELAQLREQIRILTEENPDERVSSLAAQLAAQRAEVDAVQVRHQARLAELTTAGSAARAEVAAKAEEVAKLKADVQALQEKVKQANAKAAAARAAGGSASAAAASSGGGGGGGVAGGVDPSIVAGLEQRISELESSESDLQGQVSSVSQERDAHAASITELQARIAALEKEVAAHSGSLADQLAAREAELVAAHTTRVTELETQVQELTDKLRITKKKAKELHDALQAETAQRQTLEGTVTELQGTVASMESSTAEALASVNGLKSEISKREGVITQKEEAITALKETEEKLRAEVQFLEVRNVEEIRRRKEFQFKYEDAKGKVRVYARVRPFSKAEIAAQEKTLLRPGTNEWTLCINETQKNYQGVVSDNWRPIEFDHVFQFGLENTKGNASQAEVFEETKIFAELSVQGINCCVFAYGQSGTGKTFTMAGIKPNENNGFTKDLLGLKPRMIERVYAMKDELRKTHDIDISCYMLEIYLNQLEDVFWKLQTQRKYAGKEKSKWPEPPELKVRVDAKRKVTVDNSIILKFDTGKEMQDFCDEAEATRRVRKTGLNEESSRSHLIFALICTATDKKTGKKTTGKLSLVDLAGSERSDKTNVEGLSKAARQAMMEEGIAINESLRMLKSVFRILGEANKPLAKGQKAEIVQYRGNMLTELMQDSLGGNAKTLMFVNVGPAASNISESVDSLAYGDLVKNITNEKVSADADMEEQLRFLQVQLRAYEAKFGALDA